MLSPFSTTAATGEWIAVPTAKPVNQDRSHQGNNEIKRCSYYGQVIACSMEKQAGGDHDRGDPVHGDLTMADETKRESWTPIPFGNVMTGYLVVNAVKCVAYLLLLWLGGLVMPRFALPFDELATSVIVAALVGAIPQAVVFRRFTLQERRDDSLSPLCPILESAVMLIVASGVGYLITRTVGTSLAVGVVMAAIDLAGGLITMPKREDQIMSREKVAENMEKTRTMTQEVFADEIAHVHGEQQRKLDETNRRYGIDKLHGR